MKKIILLLQFVLLTSIASAQVNPTLPALNATIIDYVKTTIGKKVDRGECWDLANQALTRANAAWTFPNQFGKVVDPQKDSIYPGDLIQFTNVKMKSSNGETWTFPKHTAIVYEVISPGVYKIAEQNVNGKRKVQIDDLIVKDKVAGKMIFYRPVPK
ncbi:MAG: hypothetical protein IPP32_17605 [Bacteroidetes bacterium]|nr:hypothetical protein [Bacteroidota bacterium]